MSHFLADENGSKRPDHRILPVIVFAVAAFAITLLAGLPVVLSTQAALVNGAHVIANPLVLPTSAALGLLIIGGYGPALAAILVTAVVKGRPGVVSLVKQFKIWRVPLRWYLLALVLPSTIALVALVFWTLFAGQSSGQWFALPGPLQLSFLLFGPWGEELGWRGYALPQLQQRFGLNQAGIIVGGIWFAWHQWPLATPAGPSTIDAQGLLTFFVYIVSASVVFAWLYNSARGSLPVAWMAHVGLDLNLVSAHGVPFQLTAGLFALAAGVVVLLTRGPRKIHPP